MSFQWIIDNCAGISIDHRPTVAQTVTRNNRVSSVVRGGYTYRFSVEMPVGYRYSDARPHIAAYEAQGLHTTDTISIPQDYISGYKGAASGSTGWSISATQYDTEFDVTSIGGANITGPAPLLAAGDVLNIKTGSTSHNAYTVTEDATWFGSAPVTVKLNRAILESTGSYTIDAGSSTNWDVICVSMPQWNIFDYNLVNWSGSFVFYEVLR